MELVQPIHENASEAAKERRAFSVDAAIIKSIVREQSSSPAKAVAELVMNSVDAGATRIDVFIGDCDFTITDDGRGFADRDEVVSNFEVFGKPHVAGDAYFGRYRVGRGQIMAHAAVTWRTGLFEMEVDIDQQAESVYTLTTHTDVQPGCVVSGKANAAGFCRSLLSDFGAPEYEAEETAIRRSPLAQIIRYMPVPVYVNGFKVTASPAEETWDMEDEFAWYRFDREFWSLCIYDRGLRVGEIEAKTFFGRGGVVVSKQPLQLNMARNEVSMNCKVWWGIRNAALVAFDMRLETGKKKLDRWEARALISNLLNDEFVISDSTKCKIRKTQFIEDAFGEKRTPEQMLSGNAFTMYQREHSMVAERLQRDKIAQPLPSYLFFEAGGHNPTEDDCLFVVKKLRSVLGFAGSWSWLGMDEYARRFHDTHEFVDEESLSGDEALVLECLRKVNFSLAQIFKVPERRLVVGLADRLRGWTDGLSYVAIGKWMLQRIRDRGGEGVLVALLVHEYCHGDPSLGQHAHDYDFYERFHAVMNRRDIHDLADKLHGMYAAGVAKQQIRPSSALRYHVDRMAGISRSLRPKIVRKM